MCNAWPNYKAWHDVYMIIPFASQVAWIKRFIASSRITCALHRASNYSATNNTYIHFKKIIHIQSRKKNTYTKTERLSFFYFEELSILLLYCLCGRQPSFLLINITSSFSAGSFLKNTYTLLAYNKLTSTEHTTKLLRQQSTSIHPAGNFACVWESDLSLRPIFQAGLIVVLSEMLRSLNHSGIIAHLGLWTFNVII
jgi:hypothetical protein